MEALLRRIDLRPWQVYLLLLGACLVSRLPTTIYYIEDIDALRFFLSAYEYDVASLRPHFPGYPVFCFLLRILYLLTGQVALSFSILGALSTFILIISTVNLSRLLWPEIKAVWLAGILFFNPLLWIMSNSYMPDLMGLAVLMAALYFFTKAYLQQDDRSLYGFQLMTGLLGGIRLSYLPFLILPWLVLFIRYRRLWWQQSGVLILAIALWLVPMIVDTGFTQLISVALRHTEGHFNEWGGSVISSEVSLGQRFASMIQSIWANGMNGWWMGRKWYYALYSIPLIALLVLGILQLRRQLQQSVDTKVRKAALLVFGSLMVYLVWAFFFQNIVYKPRHILPAIPFLCLLLGLAYSALTSTRYSALLIVTLAMYIGLTGWIINAHQKPSAISQMKDQLLLYNSDSSIFRSAPVMNYYMIKQGWNTGKVYKDTADTQPIKDLYLQGYEVLSVGNIDSLLQAEPVEVIEFHHDPYVSRMWSDLTLYRYQRR
jgi:4-amino-4-deoxy-L-arabinose transferase-like glycosyltransferase